MRSAYHVGAIGVFCAAISLSGCILIGEPCKQFPSEYSLAGTWRLAEVNGQPLPAAGFVIPSSSDRLRGGALSFAPRPGQCESDVPRESGTFLAEYELLNASGAPKPTQIYSGGFEHGGELTAVRDVKIQADGRSSFGKSYTTELRFVGTLPQLGGVTVTFRR